MILAESFFFMHTAVPGMEYLTKQKLYILYVVYVHKTQNVII